MENNNSIDTSTLINVELDGINSMDVCDLVDAYICYAEHADGTPLTNEELEAVSDDHDSMYSLVIDYIH
tara:strand:- start:1051 stop:1257 length:207 start_codon:yes stop_codon:yes gene_type:complete